MGGEDIRTDSFFLEDSNAQSKIVSELINELYNVNLEHLMDHYLFYYFFDFGIEKIDQRIIEQDKLPLKKLLEMVFDKYNGENLVERLINWKNTIHNKQRHFNAADRIERFIQTNFYCTWYKLTNGGILSSSASSSSASSSSASSSSASSSSTSSSSTSSETNKTNAEFALQVQNMEIQLRNQYDEQIRNIKKELKKEYEDKLRELEERNAKEKANYIRESNSEKRKEENPSMLPWTNRQFSKNINYIEGCTLDLNREISKICHDQSKQNLFIQNLFVTFDVHFAVKMIIENNVDKISVALNHCWNTYHRVESIGKFIKICEDLEIPQAKRLFEEYRDLIIFPNLEWILFQQPYF